MKTRVRSTSIATAVAALGAVLVTAAPAPAAPSGLTAAYCQAQAAGGTFTFTKKQGTKTCTIASPTLRQELVAGYTQRVTAPYGADIDTAFYQLDADGYEGTYDVSNLVRTSTVLTQKGGGAIERSPGPSTVEKQVITFRNCYSLIFLNGQYYTYRAAIYQQCDALGIYPDLDYVGS